MGRLAAVKGFDLLLTAYSRTCATTDTDLVIMGEGPERALLENLARSLGIADRVHLPGQLANPQPVLNGADVFVLSSRHEGFPNALLEAMALGIPVVAFQSVGVDAIIRDGVDGIIVPNSDVGLLSAAIDRLLQDILLRRRLGAAARNVLDRFSLQTVLDSWDRALRSVLHRSAKPEAT
jgi:glycosyltransferase involved in cell wall biosynthesis